MSPVHPSTERRVSIIAILVAALLAGCTSKTEFGDCIGAFDDKKPGLEYKVSVLNVFLGIVFVETIIVPIYVVVDQTLCPVAKKS